MAQSGDRGRITSCTNTFQPSVMMASGLVSEKSSGGRGAAAQALVKSSLRRLKVVTD